MKMDFLSTIWSNLKFFKFYYIAIGISSIILTLSLFFQTVGIDNQKVQLMSLIGVAYGTVAWLFDETQPKVVKPLNWDSTYRFTQVGFLILFSLLEYSVIAM